MLARPADLQRLLTVEPADADALHDIGLAFYGAGDLAGAVRWLDRSIGVRGGDAIAHHNRGETLARAGRNEEALASYRRAVGLLPDFIQPRIGLGNMLFRLGRVEEAESALQPALVLAPANVHVLNNLGNAVRSQCQAERALPFYQRALAIDPGYPEARWNRGLSRLALRDFAAGFADFEARWRLPGRPPRALPDLAWDGSPDPALRLLVTSEQGYGDTLQFARFLPAAAQRVGRLALVCQPGLGRLMAASFPEVEVSEGQATVAASDRHVPLLSLPFVLGLSPPSVARYLRPSEEARGRARRIDRTDDLLVGVCWAGSGRSEDLEGAAADLRRSFKPEHLMPLSRISGIRFVSLQFGQPAPDWMEDGMAGVRDFDDTAAVIDQLDLIFSVDTAVAHLAAVLGRPAWVVPRPDACWRWQESGFETSWYPTVRLYRTQGAFDPEGVVERVVADLTEVRRRRGG